MRPLESYTERNVKRWADDHGILNVKLTPQGQRAYPDRLFFLFGGKPMLIEFKRAGEEPTKLQSYLHGKLQAAKYDVRWTDSADEAIGWLKEQLRGGA